MAIFQVSSRAEQVPAPPKRRPRRFSRAWVTFFRIQRSVSISALLFVLALKISGGSSNTFLLLPVFLSLFITSSRSYTLNTILNSTWRYLVLTLCLALIYYGLIASLNLLIHLYSDPQTVPIILVTTTLAWAIIFEPVHTYFQTLIERRFNVRNRAASKAVEAFTATLREEIDFVQLRERFLDVLQQTLQPYTVSLWVRVSHTQREQANAPTEIEIGDDDPLIAYLLSHPGVLEIEQCQLTSPLLQDLKQRSTEIILPLASQGILLGLFSLGARLQALEYSSEELTLLNTLAVQVAPALRVVQLVREQQEQVRERERIEQELRTAQDIQQTFLPKNVPVLVGWQLAPYYRPAREVGGDFYDFIPFHDGRLGIIIGDVTDKGIPAALVMTATRTMLRTASQEPVSPGEVLARVNDLLYADTPAHMFVTCFYAILDPNNGLLSYANAGHEPPYRQGAGHAVELDATGMPLGMLPGTHYDEYELTLAPGEGLFFYSDGLVEAHNAQRAIFGFPRLKSLVSEHPGGPALIDFLCDELAAFTGNGEEQEDDVTMLALCSTSAHT